MTITSSSGLEEDPRRPAMDERKRKRMISNRESARRSRLKKQERLEELASEAIRIRNENRQIAASVALTTSELLPIDAENSVLKAQIAELARRLQSLNDIIALVDANSIGSGRADNRYPPLPAGYVPAVHTCLNSFYPLCVNQPHMSSTDASTH